MLLVDSTVTSWSPETAPGNPSLPVIPGYNRFALIGEGGMGQVYRAVHQGRARALKLLAPGQERYRFQQEFQLLARLSHPALVAAYQQGEYCGRPFYTMELVEGVDLLTYLREHPQALEDVFSQLLEVLDYIHSQGVVHRDLKPGNLLVQADGRLRLLDFGLAREVDGAVLTRTGSVMGTPSYMSPEQVQSRVIDQRSDLYSVGVILYQAVTGRLPYYGHDIASLLYKVVHEPPEPSGREDRLGCYLSWLLEKNPQHRPASAREALERWRGHFGRPLTVRVLSLCGAHKMGRWIRGHGLQVALLSYGLANLLAWVSR